MALDKARPNLPRDILLTPDVQAACEGAQAICLVTEWPEFINANWRSIRERVNAPYSVVDGRNALDRRYLESLGFNYCGVGRKFSLPLALYR
jgi:UDPglucose 6-dehydrogenase